jgi:dihydrodipicolinate synthase/N-acetylneuraminate lyase
LSVAHSHAGVEGKTSVPALKPGRKIEGISAVLLPFGGDDLPDWESFRGLLDRTWSVGLTPAVNMDTGYVHLLSAAERAQVLLEAENVARGRRFIAGAFVENEEGEPVALYHREIDHIRQRGGTPIVFQCSALARLDDLQAADFYAQVGAAGGPLLAFELGTMFAPFGRIYSEVVIRRLMDVEAFVGLKHSSLDRKIEWGRLEIRNEIRPEFKIYTGNDLAIDMVFYGSDYLLGLSAFAVEGFATRDRLWAERDPRALELNDLLQYLGQLAFRRPVPAYKHSAAQFLKVRKLISTARTHPRSPRRPDADVPLLMEIAERLDAALDHLKT